MKRAVGLCLALFALIVAAQDNISSQDRYHEEKPPEGLQCAAACGLWILMNKSECGHGSEPATCLCTTGFREDLDKCLAKKPVDCVEYGVTDKQVYEALAHTCSKPVKPHGKWYGANEQPFPRSTPPSRRRR